MSRHELGGFSHTTLAVVAGLRLLFPSVSPTLTDE